MIWINLSQQKDILSERYPDSYRNHFGAPLALIEEDKQRAIVCIRNVQFQAGRLEVFAGYGQVDESNMQSEWQEVLAKQESVIMNYD